MEKMSLTDGVLEVLVELSPLFIFVCTAALVLSWFRLALDAMSGRGL